MKHETEVELRLSPGAHVTIGAPWGAVFLAMLLGIAAGIVAARRGHRWRRRHRTATERAAADLAEVPLRLPGESPDVQSEL